MSTWVIMDCTVNLSENDGAHTASFVSAGGTSLEVRDIRDGGGSYAPQWFRRIKDGDEVRVSYRLGDEYGLTVEPLA